LILKSKLRIVDLAGSEKYTLKKDMSQQEKVIRVQELTSINSSLSALGLCISALSEINHKKNQTNNIHVPYRNSKLTRILKDSLDEASNVALVICISPSLASYKETLSTL
jgi:kinesin family member 18/19